MTSLEVEQLKGWGHRKRRHAPNATLEDVPSHCYYVSYDELMFKMEEENKS